MKFQTQHKFFSSNKGGGKVQRYSAHRNKNSVWVTGGDKNQIIVQHQYGTTAKAKNWMNRPSFTF